jgi:hypothetical protein
MTKGVVVVDILSLKMQDALGHRFGHLLEV